MQYIQYWDIYKNIHNWDIYQAVQHWDKSVISLAAVAQGRAPDKGDMGASPICGKYGNQPLYSSLNIINIDILMMNYMIHSPMLQSLDHNNSHCHERLLSNLLS